MAHPDVSEPPSPPTWQVVALVGRVGGREILTNRRYLQNRADWFALMNRGVIKTAVGNSDVHKLDDRRTIIDSRFEVGYARDTTVAGRPAVVPTISGRGWIHGIHQIGLDPSDPYPEGFRVADTWGDAFDLLK